MTTTELLAFFANSELIQTLDAGDKLSASLITTVLGMGITFSALIVLLIIITMMNKILNKTPADPAPVKAPVAKKTMPRPAEVDKTERDNELVAALTTALAMALKTSTSNIVIKNIEKVDNQSPQWNRAGIIEQMNSRF